MRKIIKKSEDKFYDTLKKCSPKIGLDLPYFVKGGFWLGLGQGFNIFRAFIISVILANILTREIYGQYSFVISIMTIALMFALPGLGPVITDSVARGFHGTYFASLKKIFKWSFLGSFLLLSIGLYGLFIGRQFGTTIFLILAFLFPFYSISNYYHRLFHGLKRFDISAKLGISFDLMFIIVISLVALLSKNLLYIILSLFLLHILIQGVYTLFYAKRYVNNNKIDKKGISFGKNYSFAQTFQTIASRIDYLIIAYFLGFEQLAIFTIIILVPDQLKSAFTTFTPLILPKISSEKKTSKKIVMNHFYKMIGLASIAILIYSVIAIPLFKIFYPKYIEYVWYSIIFNFSFIAISNILFISYFIKEKRSDIMYKINISSSLFFIAASFLLILNYGLIGAIAARMSYRLFFVLLSYIYSINIYS